MKAHKLIKLLLLTVGLLALCHIALAGGVRTVFVKPNTVEPIYLSMGKSTVLRFRDRPRKVVIGNQNYFSVEFIENDVALQPLGTIKTNMFVYTENRTYAFYLLSGQGRGDDLAIIEWQPAENKSKEILKRMTPMTIPKKIKNLSIKLDGALKLTPVSIQYSPDHRMYVLDLNVENISTKNVELKEVTLSMAKNKLSLSKQILVKEVENLKSKQKSRLRLFFGLKEKSNLNVIFSSHKSRTEFILKKDLL